LTNLFKVSYLGPEGTFSQLAATSYFTGEQKYIPLASIDDVFSSVERSDTDFGVVPVENSTEGAVNNTQDCLIDTSLQISGEVIVPITHNLMVSHSFPRIETPKLIVSHRQSLAQCRQWLTSTYPGVPIEEVASNARAAQLASEQDGVAAIAGELAAQIYKLKIVHRSIQDKSNNSTRFLVLSPTGAGPTGKDKTSILVHTGNKPGALFRILEPLEKLGISLTKIETRPSKIEAWEYVFFMDFEGHKEDSKVLNLFSQLKTCTAEIKVLGSYPRFGSES
jgi:chorismate mutase/prephenate dehydratase